jgi:GTPase
MVKAFNERWPFAGTFLVSALSGDGVADLKAHVAAQMPPGPWLYPEDQVADVPLRLLAAEITREKIFLRLHEELPYASTVETESWKERKDGSVRVDQVIYVEREGQRKIVLGKNGQTIKAIGQAARTEIAELIGQPVHLFLFVKVRSTWASDPERLRTMGLELPRR